MDTYKKTNAAQVTVPGDTWNSLMEHASALRHALGNALQHLPSTEWPKFLDVRNEYDRVCREATAHIDKKDTEALFTIDQVHQALLDHGCFSNTQREDILASLSKDVAIQQVGSIAESTAKLTIESLNGDQIVCYGTPLDMMTLQKVYRTLLDGRRAWDDSEEKSAPIAYLRAKASSQPWNSFELAPSTDPNAFPVFGHVLAGAPLGVVDQVDKDDEEWGAHAWVSLHRPVKVGTPVYVAPQAQALPTSEHGPVVKIIGVGPEYRPDEHDRGEWREHEDGVCLEFADGYRDCYYLSDIFAYQASPAEELLQDVTSYIGCGGYNGANLEQLADRIRDEFDRLSHKNQMLEQAASEGIEFLMHGEKMAFKVGVQQFTLDYEPTEPAEFQFMRSMLLHAFASFSAKARTTAKAKGLSLSEAREYLRGLHAGYGYGLTANDSGYVQDLTTYGDEIREARYASYSVEQLENWRATEKKIIQLLASISILTTSDELYALEALPREAVIRVVDGIKQAVENYTRLIGYSKLVEARSAK